MGGSVRLKNLKKFMSAKLEFPEGWGVPSMGEVWIFSAFTQYENRIGLQKQLHCMWSVEVGNMTRGAAREALK